MGVQIAALKAAVIEIDARARLLQTNQQLTAAEASYDTLLITINTLLDAESDSLYGWQHTAQIITDTRTRLQIDALAPSRIEELQMRIATLLDLPDLTSVSSQADIAQAIAAAINVGVPRYNAGDIWGCCTIYWGTMQSLIHAPATRGFAGYSRVINVLRSAIETEPSPFPLDAVGVDDFTWSLRHAFDEAVRIASTAG
ncbi:MAG: hypothetical protein ACXWP6_19305 [Ktedonobacterales bacterium]